MYIVTEIKIFRVYFVHACYIDRILASALVNIYRESKTTSKAFLTKCVKYVKYCERKEEI